MIVPPRRLLKDVYFTVRRLFPSPVNVATILAYHSVSRGNDIFFTVRPDIFQKQMEWLCQHRYNVVSLDKLQSYRQAGHIPNKTVAITFDDGYQDNYVEAFPVLRRFNFPATIFLTVSDLGGSRSVRGVEMKILSQAEIRQLEESGLVDIQPHTLTHPNLTEISQDQVMDELRRSKETIEGILGKECHHFAYPRGRYNENVVTAVRRVGFRYAYTTEKGVIGSSAGNYVQNRNGVYNYTSLTQYKVIASGL